MSYASVTQLEEYLNLSTGTDTSLLIRLLDAATSYIEQRTGRRWEAASATKIVSADDAHLLRLPEEAMSITEIVNGCDLNGNGGDTMTVGDDFIPMPLQPPYRRILSGAYVNSGAYFKRSVGEFQKITATWGASNTPPPDIVQATIRLAGYFYRQRDAQVFDVTADPDTGQLVIPKGIPADVEKTLRLRKLVTIA